MKKFLLGVFVVMFSIFPFLAQSKEAYATEVPQNETSKAYEYTKAFVSEESNNVLDYQTRQKNRIKYLKEVVEEIGYQVTDDMFQTVKYTNRFLNNANEEAYNLIVTKKSSEQNAKTIVISANYDNAEGLLKDIQYSDGTSSNGVGVGLMLQLLEELKDKPLNYNIQFAFFSASEVGLKGSRLFVDTLTNEEKESIILSINLWGVGAGDKLYMYDDEVHWEHYDYIKNVADAKNVDINKIPADKKVIQAIEDNIGLNYNHQALLSDTAPFVAARIPSISFFSGNYVEGGYVQSKAKGTIFGTKYDTLENFDAIFGDKGRKQLNQTALLVTELVTDSVLEEVMVKSFANKPDYSFFTTKNDSITIITGVVTGVILLCMVITYVILKNKADKSNDKIKPLYIDIDKMMQENGNPVNNVEPPKHEDPFGLDDNNNNNDNNNSNDNPFGI